MTSFCWTSCKKTYNRMIKDVKKTRFYMVLLGPTGPKQVSGPEAARLDGPLAEGAAAEALTWASSDR